MMAKKSLRLFLGIGFAVFFLWLILRQITFEDILIGFTGVNYSWVIAAIAMFALGYSCRIERWRLMIAIDSSPGLTWKRCAGPFLLSFAANNVLPFRAGDALRAFAFNKELGTSSGVVIATLFVERLLDLLMLLVLLGVALSVFGLDTKQFAGLGSAALIAISLTLLLVLVFPRFVLPIVVAIARLVVRIVPSVGPKLLIEINKSFKTLCHLTQGDTMFKLVVWSILTWLAEGCVFWFTAKALPSLTVPLAGWLALPVGTLATLIPSTPGYIGTFDFFTVQSMTILGNDSSASAAYALLVHALLWFWPTLLGGLYLLIRHVKQQELLKGASL
jgi:uncharacterized protein (TIRG00374 family)